MKQLIRKNERGFIHILTVLIVVVVLASICFVGWRVMNKNGSKSSSGSSATTTSNGAVIPTTGGGINGGWKETTILPNATSSATSVVYNGYIYEIGGSDKTASQVASVEYAKINADGTIGSWTATTALPEANDAATSVVNNGYIYVIGGNPNHKYFSTVEYAMINADGTIGSWKTTTALPTARVDSASITYNGYIYEISGDPGSGLVSTVEYAKINADGTIGSWKTTTALPTARGNSGSVAYKGYVYVIGGYTKSGLLNNVEYAKINADGTIGSWKTTTALPNTIFVATSVVNNGYIYEIGGQTISNGDKILDAVEYAKINADGTIGSWVATAALPEAKNAATSVSNNGYIYEIGGGAGNLGNTISGTVEYSVVN